MTIHKILYLPDERLRKVAEPVKTFDESLQTLIDDMFETMHHAKGVGLAAPQIGIGLQLSVIDVSEDKNEPLVIINPQISEVVGMENYQEGCLSVPGVYDTVKRAKKVTVKAQNPQGEFFEITAEGLLGECLQHEIDHLNGKLFIDLLSPLKKEIARKKLAKFKKNQAKKS